MKTRFVHLKAWDQYMGAAPYWIRAMQERAEKDGAPEDAIYKDSSGRWVGFGEVTSGSTRMLIEKRVAQIKEEEGEV
jgi:hypothetical protein